MCGICGVLTPDGAAARPEFAFAVAKMSQLMARRGPDSHGAWVDERGFARFGFRRLAVIDTSSAADQPMLSADGRSAIVMNGEIYNFASCARNSNRSAATSARSRTRRCCSPPSTSGGTTRSHA